ncbi:DUF5641 domain-containing protein [Trichonephila clavipes]|nr:DUF5641 domain-containing protein [Trichonephila clavipes]
MLESKEILSLAKFNLRGWVHTGVSEAEKGTLLEEEKKVPVLGLIWKPDKDTLSANWEENSKINEIPVTKRKILSAVHRIFDPIGFTCPVTLEPKILLQECWKLGVSWDTELPLSISRKFERWKEHLKCLNNLEIPRCISKELSPNSDLSLHVFCDASKAAYASCVILRTEVGGAITCQLVQARARVASIKPITIPRLELLACTIGSRLINTTKIDLGLENVPIYCWVQEIRRLTNPEDWKHIPGILNPADLPSRGCGVVELIASLWWEGPSWLNKPREEWPLSEACPDRATIDSERKRTVASTINHEPKEMDYLSEISSFKKIIRVTAWIYRFYHNLRKQRNDRDFGELITQETDAAERKICDSESVINSRPLTYLSEDQEDLVALTPAMFLQEIKENGVPDLDLIDSQRMNRRFLYRQRIRQELRKRFRLEYLCQLKSFSKSRKEDGIKEGDIGLIGDTTSKRIYWPLAKVIKLIPGRDGRVRVVEVSTSSGSFLRPIQRLYPLEVSGTDTSDLPEQIKETLKDRV